MQHVAVPPPPSGARTIPTYNLGAGAAGGHGTAVPGPSTGPPPLAQRALALQNPLVGPGGSNVTAAGPSTQVTIHASTYYTPGIDTLDPDALEAQAAELEFWARGLRDRARRARANQAVPPWHGDYTSFPQWDPDVQGKDGK
jgi:hypothetical protein